MVCSCTRHHVGHWVSRSEKNCGSGTQEIYNLGDINLNLEVQPSIISAEIQRMQMQMRKLSVQLGPEEKTWKNFFYYPWEHQFPVVKSFECLYLLLRAVGNVREYWMQENTEHISRTHQEGFTIKTLFAIACSLTIRHTPSDAKNKYQNVTSYRLPHMGTPIHTWPLPYTEGTFSLWSSFTSLRNNQGLGSLTHQGQSPQPFLQPVLQRDLHVQC